MTHVGLLLRRIRASRREGNGHIVAGILRRLLDTAHPPRTIRSASDTFFPPDCALLNAFWIPSRVSSTFFSWAGWLTSQSFCGARRMRAPLAPPRIVGAAERGGRRPGGRDQLGDRQARGEDLALEVGDVLRVDQFMIDCGHRVLPDQFLFGTSGPR
jgi:hypothetical protein